jgi:hypothetical protein
MPPLTSVNNHDNIATIRNLAGLATPMALRVAVTLGLPDRLRGDGAAVKQVATELNVSPVALELLLSHLATSGSSSTPPPATGPPATGPPATGPLTTERPSAPMPTTA